MKRPRPKTIDLCTPIDKTARLEDSAAPANESVSALLELGPADSLGALVAPESDGVDAAGGAGDLPSLSAPDGPVSGETAAMAATAPTALPYYAIASIVSLLVILAPVLFAWSYQRDMIPVRNDLFALCVVAMLAIGPAALVWLTAFVLHQTARLAAETRRTQILTDQLTQPTALAARGAGSAVDHVRREIEHAAAAAARARSELLSLREVLASESERLIEATEGANRTATNLTRELSVEREKMNILAGTLDAQAAGVAEAITRHARMVAEASDLAETQLREAEAALTARAADLAAAAGEASDAARVASEDLSRQVARLETAGQGVGDQARLVEDGLTEQRAALVTVAHGLRADQEAFAAEAETQLARLNEVVVHAREGASELSETAARGAEILGQLLNGAGDQLAQIVEATAHERDLLSASAAQSLGAISEIASREREAMESQAQATVDHVLTAAEQARREMQAQAAAIAAQRDGLAASGAESVEALADTFARERQQLELQARESINAVVEAADKARQAMEIHAETARDKVDRLGEAAFAAGQRAETVFENRLDEARRLIERSAELVDAAGAASLSRLDEGVQRTRATLGELEALLGDVDARIARLPADAQARAEAVRETIERGMDDLMGSARRAAEETQNIDAAFQDRVRRNYDMLSEAVRLMGVVAGAAGGGARAPSPLSSPPAARTPPAATETRAVRHEPAADPKADVRAPEPRPLDPPATAESGLRPRLRLTPTASDEEFKQVFDAAGGRTAPRREGGESKDAGADGWTWKELLSSMDDEPVIDETHLAELVLGEIETMGIDAGALLPRGRIEEFAAAVQAGQTDAIRAGVRRLAPAAVRRLSRRLMADRVFRGQCDRFVQRYHGLIVDAARRGEDGVVVSALLGSDQGRAYMLFDTAINDSL